MYNKTTTKLLLQQTTKSFNHLSVVLQRLQFIARRHLDILGGLEQLSVAEVPRLPDHRIT
jgi:hypothetical protein